MATEECGIREDHEVTSPLAGGYISPIALM